MSLTRIHQAWLILVSSPCLSVNSQSSSEKPGLAIHLLNCSIAVYMYKSIRINLYVHEKQLYKLETSVYVQLFCRQSYRGHSFPKHLFRSSPSMRLFHTLLIQLDLLSHSAFLPRSCQLPKWLFQTLHTLFALYSFTGFDKCIMSFVYHCNIIQNGFTSAKLSFKMAIPLHSCQQ